MPYKKKSPFASYRDPKQAKRNFNPIDFKMPDLNSIYNKTANGSTTTTDLATDNKTGSPEEGKTPGLMPKSSSSKMLEQIKGTEENKEKQQSVAKKRKTQVREDRKKFNKAYRDAREAKNMGNRFQTSEEQGKAQEAFNDMKGERKFRTKSLLNNENPEDARGRLKEDARQAKINKAAKEDNFVQPSASLAKRPKSIIDNQFYNEPSKSSKSGAKIMKTKNAYVKDADGGFTSDVFGRGRAYEVDDFDFIHGDERLDAIQDSTPKQKKIPIYNNSRNNPEPTYGEKLKKQNKIANSDERAEMESTLNSKMKTFPALKYMGAGSDKSDKRIQNMKKISMPKPNITVNSVDDIGGGFDVPSINQNNTGSLMSKERSSFKNQFSNSPMISRKGSAFPMVSDSPLNVVTNNRNNAAGTGSVIVNNTGTGTGNSSGGTGGGGGGTGIGSGSGSGGSSSNNNFGNSVADSGALDTDGSSVSNSGNGGTATTGSGSGGGNFNTSNAGTGSQNVGSGGTTAASGNKVNNNSGNNSGNTGVTGAFGPGGRPSGGSNAATAVADGIKQADRPTNYRPPTPPPIRREDTIGKDGQVFTPNPNRAAKGDKTMTNNVLPGLAAGSVPSRGIQRDIQFNNKAMSSGDLYAPPQPTGMNANTDASLNKTTSTGNSEAMSMFAAFSDPKEIDSNIKEDTENLNDTIDKNMSSLTQSISGMPKPGPEGGGSGGKMKFLKNLIKDESGAAPEMSASRSSFAKAIDFGSLKKGALKQELNVPEDETIPKSKLQIKSGDSKLTQKRKRFAETMSKFKK